MTSRRILKRRQCGVTSFWQARAKPKLAFVNMSVQHDLKLAKSVEKNKSMN